MVTVVSNYCQLSQTQLSQTFAEKFTVTEELLQSLKKQRYPEMKKVLSYCIILRKVMMNLEKKLKIFFTILLETQQMRPYRLSDLLKMPV